MRVLSILLAAAALLSKRPVQSSDVPAALQQYLPADNFGALVRWIDRDTAQRERLGEEEHLAYFILQSGVFTKRPKIEPAISARQFVENLSSAAPPPDVRARMEDFLVALRRPTVDERLSYWKSHLGVERRSLAVLDAAYTSAMRFLYQKEFLASDGNLYQRRGHSVDTQVEANYAVSTALAVIRELDPAARLERVLIVGPGLDFAPRTGLRDELPPQSYQPYLTADSLLRWKLADPGRLAIQCVDISPQVVDFIEGFARREKPALKMLAGGGDPDYQEYFREAGRRIGVTEEQTWGRTILLRKELAARVRAERLNILTERYDPSPAFDLVIATNVLVYFSPTELALALANIHSMMRPGGYFVHNELRPEVEAIGKMLHMPPIQGRTLQITQGAKRPLLDAFVIHRTR